VPESYDAFVYVFSGEARVGGEGRAVADGQMALLGPGDSLQLACAADVTAPARLLLIGGVPLREPVARWGPFVMNTEAEIRRAIADFRSGRLGEIAR
jgi:redox-sensitive bicupin YhaK (pirin superfamily)